MLGFFFLFCVLYFKLCYVMFCCVRFCYVMLCYVMLCYVMLCYVMLCYTADTNVSEIFQFGKAVAIRLKTKNIILQSDEYLCFQK